MSSVSKNRDGNVVVKRGNAILGRLNSSELPDKIKQRKLQRSDRISSDGRTWVRLDQHPQLKWHFSGPKKAGSRRVDSGLFESGRKRGSAQKKGSSGGMVFILLILIAALIYFMNAK
jgi:hypothetical protein